MKRIVLFVLINFYFVQLFALKPDTTYTATPSIYGLIYKEFSIYTKDSMKLNAWFYPAQESLSDDSMLKYFNDRTLKREYEFNDKIKNPTIIVCNGDAGNMSQLKGLAYMFCTNGFNVLTFDWRGFGKSQAWPIDTNCMIYEELIIDYNAVVDAVIRLPEVDNDRIGVFGFSTGAYLSFIIFEKRSEIKAMVGRGLFTSYFDVFNNLKKIFPEKNIYYPKSFDNEYRVISLAQNITKPVFLIVGENDERTPISMSIEILYKVKSYVRELWIVKDASHGGNLAPEIIAFNKFQKKTIRFFNENL